MKLSFLRQWHQLWLHIFSATKCGAKKKTERIRGEAERTENLAQDTQISSALQGAIFRRDEGIFAARGRTKRPLLFAFSDRLLAFFQEFFGHVQHCVAPGAQIIEGKSKRALWLHAFAFDAVAFGCEVIEFAEQ